MSIADLIAYIVDLGVTVPIYPLDFPANAPDEAIIVDFGQGGVEVGDVYTATIEVTVRSKHPSGAEALANSIESLLHMKTNVRLADVQFILIKKITAFADYRGKDANNRFYYQINFRALVSQ